MARKIRAGEVLRLLESGMSRNAIARSRGMSKHGVRAVSEAAGAAGIGRAEAEGMSAAEVCAALFPEKVRDRGVHPDPDRERVHRGLARVGVAPKRLREGYRDGQRPRGGPLMSYDRFCKRHRGFTVRRQVVGRAGHRAGRILEVDWAGPTMSLVGPAAGEVPKAFPFVACLPFGRLPHVGPTPDMREDAWLRRRVHALAHMGGPAPRMVPGSLRTGARAHPRGGGAGPSEACREMAARYGSAAMPARVAAPRDRPSAESEAWQAALEIVAALRDEALTDFNQLKRVVAEKPEEHDSRPSSKREGTRREVFEERERPLPRPLPAVPHEVCERVCGGRARRDCRVAHRRSCCSASRLAVGGTVGLRATDATAGVFLAGERLAARPPFPSLARNRRSTHAGDLPGGRSHSGWGAGRIRRWADRVGPSCGGWRTASSGASAARGRASARPSPRSGPSAAARGRGRRGRARRRPRAACPRPGTGASGPSSRPTRTWSPERARTTAGPARAGPAACAAPTSAGGVARWAPRWRRSAGCATWAPPTCWTPPRPGTRACALIPLT